MERFVSEEPELAHRTGQRVINLGPITDEWGNEMIRVKFPDGFEDSVWPYEIKEDQ
jgi:hypothetical protein